MYDVTHGHSHKKTRAPHAFARVPYAFVFSIDKLAAARLVIITA